MNETIILTSENLHALGSNNGVGWNRKQLAVLGINWPPPNGWLKGLIGTEIEADKYRMAMSLRKSNQNQSNAKETSKENKPQQMSDDEIKALCDRMDKKIQKMKDAEYRKAKQLLLAKKQNKIELPKMYKKVHRAKHWYAF